MELKNKRTSLSDNGRSVLQRRGAASFPTAQRLFSGLVGIWLGLTLLKFGNPVILEHLVTPPSDFLEFLYQSWPPNWGYGLVAVVAVASIGTTQLVCRSPRWLVALPAIWFGWQLVAATGTVDSRLTHATLKHFLACAACFYLGLFALSRVRQMKAVWVGLLAGFLMTIWIGLGQHFGGLKETLHYIYEQTDWRSLPPEYLKKLASQRVFSTLVYPNAFAGAILLLLPMMLVVFWRFTSWLTLPSRCVLTGTVVMSGLACLYWSGSKSGWLIAMLMASVVLLRLPLERKWKLTMIGLITAVALLGFSIKFSGYIEKGATSVSARFDYWKSASNIFGKNPIFGTGPGTFSIPYKKEKAPESEMAQLAHNDYLEQASDSGVIGFLSYFLFFSGSLWFLYRKSCQNTLFFTIWLGIAGWAVQSFVEFPLYIPALAWPVFILLGWLFEVEGDEMEWTTPAIQPNLA